MKSSTFILTDESKRITKRLVNHWQHKFKVEETEKKSSIFMTDATVTLTPFIHKLNIEIDTQRSDYTSLEQVVIEHINRMAQQEYQVEWTHQA